MELMNLEHIEHKIYTIRKLQVMLDKDLAQLYQVETKVLNQAVKRNIDRFPDSFRFQLTDIEFNDLKSQSVTSSSSHGGRRYLPFVFTEQGVAMLSAVLRSDTAVKVSVQVIKAFVKMRLLVNHSRLLQERLLHLEMKQQDHEKNFEKVFKALEKATPEPKHGIFFEGQIFDAYTFVAKLIKSAKKSIILIDNYIDESVLTLLTKRSESVKATIYAAKITQQLQLDLKKHNQQYPQIEVKRLKTSHDRFLIIDDTKLYHIGASLKDLGNKWFAFSQIDSLANEILNKLDEN
ncbi:MAG: ORF6N domain-containing protein [Flavobacteriaceae bacterium]|nr:ORF6N domain-containing protein [Flavobacteriaceae bacterium]